MSCGNLHLLLSSVAWNLQHLVPQHTHSHYKRERERDRPHLHSVEESRRNGGHSVGRGYEQDPGEIKRQTHIARAMSQESGGRERESLQQLKSQREGYWSTNEEFCSGSRTSRRAAAGSPWIPRPSLSTSSRRKTGLLTPAVLSPAKTRPGIEPM